MLSQAATLAPPSIARTVFVLSDQQGHPPYRVVLRDGIAAGCSCPSAAFRPSQVCKHQRLAEQGCFVPMGDCPQCRINRDQALAGFIAYPVKFSLMDNLLRNCRRWCGAAGGWGVRNA